MGIVSAQNSNYKKVKRDLAGGECIHINGLLGQPSSYDCCSNEGIICENNHITKILLSGKNLNGSIPSSIGNLTFLKELELKSNQLSGPIPPAIGKLSNLEVLDIFDNQLSGTIPSEIGNLNSIKKLGLSANQLSGSIPPEIGNLKTLQKLFIYSNNLTGPIPPELGNLTNLIHLWLYNNQLSGSVPSEFGNLTNLQVLKLNNNQLSGPVPPEVENLPNLQTLDFSNNESKTNSTGNSERKIGTSEDSKSPDDSNTTTIIIIVASAIIVLLILVASFIYFRKKSNKNTNKYSKEYEASSKNEKSTDSFENKDTVIDAVLPCIIDITNISSVNKEDEIMNADKVHSDNNINSVINYKAYANDNDVITKMEKNKLENNLNVTLGTPVSQSFLELQSQQLNPQLQMQQMQRLQPMNPQMRPVSGTEYSINQCYPIIFDQNQGSYHSNVPLNNSNVADSKLNEALSDNLNNTNNTYDEPPPNYNEVINEISIQQNMLNAYTPSSSSNQNNS